LFDGPAVNRSPRVHQDRRPAGGNEPVRFDEEQHMKGGAAMTLREMGDRAFGCLAVAFYLMYPIGVWDDWCVPLYPPEPLLNKILITVGWYGLLVACLALDWREARRRRRDGRG
jgi:hypothetical protein